MSIEEDVNAGEFEDDGSEDEPEENRDGDEDVGENVIETAPAEPKPSGTALTINIQSWATPIVGAVMLVLGLLAGYFIRPLLPSLGSAASGTSVPIAAAPATSAPEVSVDSTPAAATQAANLQELMNYLLPQVKHFKGDPNAPVTLIEFGDFQWPYCGRFATDAGRQIEDTYVKDGKVRLAYWHMAFLGQESGWAAEASECAAEQDAFWEYHDKLFSSQSGENQGAFNKDKLKGFAKDLSLDTTAFDECLDSGKYTQAIQDSTQTAQSIGVRSTPAFLINGTPMLGAQPFASFQQVIDNLLAGSAPQQ